MTGGRQLSVTVRGEPAEVIYLLLPGHLRYPLDLSRVRGLSCPPLTVVEMAEIELACLADLRERRAAGLTLVHAA